MVLTGILAIQAGDNPRIVAQKLASYLPPGSPEPGKAGAEGGPADGAEQARGRLMARRKKHDDHGPMHVDERWIVPYADMMTLLLAVFVMLYALSDINVRKFTTFAQSLAAAFIDRHHRRAPTRPP